MKIDNSFQFKRLSRSFDKYMKEVKFFPSHTRPSFESGTLV